MELELATPECLVSKCVEAKSMSPLLIDCELVSALPKKVELDV
jgi:hypothetical protein